MEKLYTVSKNKTRSWLRLSFAFWIDAPDILDKRNCSNSHVWMWELDCEDSWVPKNWCFWTVVLEKTLASPLDCKEIQPVHSEGDQPWDFFGRNDAKAETPILWPPHAKSWLIGKDSDVGRDWEQEEKGMTEDEIAGWHHQFNGHEFEWTPGVGDGQGSLACCDSWGCKESDTTEWLNWTELNWRHHRSNCQEIALAIYRERERGRARVFPWVESRGNLYFDISGVLSLHSYF